MTNLAALGVGRTSWNTAGLRMPKRIPNVWAFSAEVQAAEFEQWWRQKVLQSKLLHCTPLHWPLLLQGGFCRSWAFRGQQLTSQLGRVGTTTGTSNRAFLLFIASDGSIASNKFHSEHACRISLKSILEPSLVKYFLQTLIQAWFNEIWSLTPI